jgi:hypothetical protein
VLRGREAKCQCFHGGSLCISSSEDECRNNSTIFLITLTLVSFKAQSLRSHALYLLIECVSFVLELIVFRFWIIATAQLFERFLNGESGDFGHRSCLT